jgi:phosphatidate cytidylyltransferase
MSDDQRRSRNRGDDDEFGPPLFADPDESSESEKLLFDDTSGPLPHWTEPPTGEMPKVLGGTGDAEGTEDLDVWSSFSGKGPVWRDDDPLDPSSGYDDVSPRVRSGDTGGHPTGETYYEPSPGDRSGGTTGPTRREPGRITIGTDPTDEGMGRPTPYRGRARPTREEQARAARGRTTGPVRTAPGRPPSGVAARDMPTAVAVGAAIAVVFILAIKWRPQAVLAIVVIVVALAAVEFFEKVTEKGYQPASVVGIVGCVACPMVGYFYGPEALALALVFAFIAGCVSFIAAPNLNSSPMPNMAITTLGVTWIGLTGAYGGLILRLETAAPLIPHLGTDTLLLLAIGVVVNDVGALFVGSAAGRTPLRGWISPNKSVEGFIGGAVLTVIAMIIVGIADKSDNWNNPNLIWLGIVIAIAAPLGDLTESMFKRNLDIKDFGSIVKGHGGVLDRFDGFLFTLPAVYYLTLVLEPWQAVTG